MANERYCTRGGACPDTQRHSSFLRERESRNRGIRGVLLIFTRTLTLPPTTICKGRGFVESSLIIFNLCSMALYG